MVLRNWVRTCTSRTEQTRRGGGLSVRVNTKSATPPEGTGVSKIAKHNGAWAQGWALRYPIRRAPPFFVCIVRVVDRAAVIPHLLVPRSLQNEHRVSFLYPVVRLSCARSLKGQVNNQM